MRWRRLFRGIVAGAALLLLTSGCQNLNAPRAQTQRTEETPDTAGQEAHLEQLDDDILFGRVSPLDYDSTFGIYRAEASGNVQILGFANESGKQSPPFYYHQRRVYTLTRDGNVNIYDAVSYTHLDVYKRQTINGTSSSSFCSTRAGATIARIWSPTLLTIGISFCKTGRSWRWTS